MADVPELTCYLHPGWAPRLRPANARRDWMDATPERFAYRCLPLAVANAHGWEIGNPSGFRARWTGGSGTEAVEIELDGGAEPHRAPVSLFGQATLTFHIEALIRTSPGWNLWVGGPPNSAKDGIAPLGGVIETDWSPYSFTMNWRFTRPDHWVRFEVDETFCFFFPVQRGVIDAVQPRVRPLDDDPELLAAFKRWSASRDAFHKHVRRANPIAPADKWQKLYYRGVGPDGEPGPADHEAKLRPAPFAREAASRCPIAPPPTPTWFAIVADPAPALAAPGPLTRETLAFTLPRVGFDPAPPPDAPVSDRALARREWALDVAEAQRALSPRTCGVPRVRDVSRGEFLDRFYAPSRPVVIEGAIADWPALTRWTPDYLKQTIGPAPVEFQGGRRGDPDYELNKDAHRRRLPFDAFLDTITREDGNDAYFTADNSAENRAALAPLRADLGRLDEYLTPGEGMLWVGPAGTFTPLHHDLTNNLLAQIVGRKRLVLAPPSEAPKLANTRGVFSDVHDIEDPARLATHARAREARRFEVEIGPGDLLFIPVGWWHQVRSLAFSVTLTYTNFRWPNDAHLTFPAN